MPQTTKMTRSDIQECRAAYEIFKRVQDETGLTQKQLAKKIKKSEQLVSGIFNEKMKIRKDVGLAMAEALGVNVREILPWYDDQREDPVKRLVSEFSRLDDEQQRDALDYIQIVRKNSDQSK